MTLRDDITSLEARVAALEEHSTRHCRRCEEEAFNERMSAVAKAEHAQQATEHKARLATAEANPRVRIDIAPDVRSATGVPIGRVAVDVTAKAPGWGHPARKSTFVIDLRTGPLHAIYPKNEWALLRKMNTEIDELVKKNVLVVSDVPADEVARLLALGK